MTQIIEIEGDVATLIRRDVIHQVPLADLLSRVERRIPMTLGILPRSAIFVDLATDEAGQSQRYSVLAELGPGVRSIIKSNRRFRLAMPWTYFLFQFSASLAHTPDTPTVWSLYGKYVFHAREQVQSYDSRLMPALLPNVDSTGGICFGSTGARVDQPLSARVDTLVNEWYLSEFNNDLIGGRDHPYPWQDESGRSWRRWVTETANSPTAWLNWPEWNLPDRLMGHTTVRGILTSTPQDRLTPILLNDSIPEIPLTMTFGRADEWLETLTATQRTRLRNAILARPADDTEHFAPIENTAIDPDDEGGEPV